MLDANDYPSNLPPAEHCVDSRDITGRAVFWLGPQPVEEALAAPIGPSETAIFATANHGRWIAECPDCHGAQLTAAEDPRFMCCECGNAAVDGVWRPVVWSADYQEIGALLDERPRDLANALPGESLEQITEENAVLIGDEA